jgi:cytochrome c biogenesis protein CcmG/thiol:disulfide interchange protein DsbE
MGLGSPMRASWLGVVTPAVLTLLIALPLHSAPRAAPAPRFKARTIDGQKIELDRLRRSGPVLLDFWATWCKPCLAAIPELQAMHKEYAGRGLTVVGISVDGPRNFAKVRPFVARLGIGYPVVLDEDGSLQQKYQVRAMPTTVLVDTAGSIVKVVQGFRPGEGAELKRAVEALLREPPRASGDSLSFAPDSLNREATADSAGQNGGR